MEKECQEHFEFLMKNLVKDGNGAIFTCGDFNKNVNETTWMGHKNKSLIVHGKAPPNSPKKDPGK